MASESLQTLRWHRGKTCTGVPPKRWLSGQRLSWVVWTTKARFVMSPVRDVTCFGLPGAGVPSLSPILRRSARGGLNGHPWLDDAPEGAFCADNGYPWRCLAGNISWYRCFGEYCRLHKQERRPRLGPRRRLKGRGWLATSRSCRYARQQRSWTSRSSPRPCCPGYSRSPVRCGVANP